MKFKKSSLIIGLLTSLAMCTPYISSVISADEASDSEEPPIFYDDFENETIKGWGVLGGVGTMTIDSDSKRTGQSSLKVSDRTHAFNGPSITIDKYVEAEETYRITGWVYHESSQTETINCTLKFSDSVNVDSYYGVAAIEARPSEWTYFEGTVETPEDLTSTLLYFECPNETMSFNIDAVRIYGKAPENQEAAGVAVDAQGGVASYTFDFESGFNDWVKRGDTRIIRTDEQHCTGNYSILSANREKVWNGPTVPIDDIQRGVEYVYEANVLYTDKKADDTHTFLLQVQYSYEGNEVYEFISSAVAEKNVWTKISGPLTVPEGATNVMLYLQTENLEEGVEESPTDLVSFYTDDVKILRADLANAKKLPVSVLIAIAAGIAALIVLIIIISKTISSGSKKKEDKEGVNGLIDALNENKTETGAPDKSPAVQISEEPKNDDKKAPEISDTKPAEKAEKAEEEKTKSDPDKSKDSKTDSDKSEKAKTDLSKPEKKETAENKNSSSGSNSGNKKKKNKKASPEKSENKPAGESAKENTKNDSAVKEESQKSNKKPESKPSDKKPDNKPSDKKTDEPKITVSSTDDSRTRDIFNIEIETFSYDDEEPVRYDESSHEQIPDDDPLEAPGDNPFDGF